MTTSLKESLHSTIEHLSEEECRQILFVQYLQQTIPPTLKRLVNDANFSILAKGFGVFRTIEPVWGEGMPASRLLVEDRR